MHFLILLSILLWFLLRTWCWINAFKRCYHCGPQSTFWLSESIAFRLTEGLVPNKLAVSKCSRASTSNPHSLQQNSTLNGAILIFQTAQKTNSYSTFHILFIILVSAYSMFLFYYDSICTRIFFSFFLFSERMKPVDDKMHLSGKCTGAQMYFCYWNLGKKKYIERDCCVVNSCHLYVLNLCVSIFVVIVELAVIFCLKMDLIFQWIDYGCHITCCWFLKLLSKVLGNIALFIFNQFLDCVSLLVYFTNLSGCSLDYMTYPGYSKSWHNVSKQICYDL